MSPFEPVGERPRWSIVYDLLRTYDVDDLVTYEAMGKVLDLDPKDERHAIQMAVRRAAREFETHDRQSLEAIPNKGYRIVEAVEHMRLAKGHQVKSSKALARGQSTIVNVDLARLDPEARKAFQLVAQAFAYQMDINRRMDIRASNLEAAVAAITETHARTDDEVADLRARLERLEGK